MGTSVCGCADKHMPWCCCMVVMGGWGPVRGPGSREECHVFLCMDDGWVVNTAQRQGFAISACESEEFGWEKKTKNGRRETLLTLHSAEDRNGAVKSVTCWFFWRPLKLGLELLLISSSRDLQDRSIAQLY